MEATLALNIVDWIIIATYFVLVFCIAFRLNKKSEITKSDDYFLAGRNLGWFLIGASLFASNIGSEHLIGLAGSGASTGVVVAQFEVLASFMLLLLGWVFVPFYIRTSVTTMPEFLELRFSQSARNYLTFISVVGYVLTKISVTIYAGAMVFEAIGVSFWVGALAVVIATGAYTIFGGLKAVIYTDAMQMVIMILGAVMISIFGLYQLGGIAELQTTLSDDFFSMWRPMQDKDFPWTGILFGAPILGVWYWCTDQYVVQRTLSARNISQARKGSIFAGFLKILPLFIFVFPGMICLALSKQGFLVLEKADYALPTLASAVLPIGLKGFFIAGLLAALMSSLSSVFNSCSTLITYDVFKKYYPNTPESKLISIGKYSTAALVVFGVLWIPLMTLISDGMYKYIQSIQAYISPPVAAVFLLGILWKRINATGALAALYTGFVLGLGRLVLEIFKANLDPRGFLFEVADMNFLHFAICLFVISSVIMIGCSLAFHQGTDNNKDLSKLTVDWQGLCNNKFTTETRRDLLLSIVLCCCVGLVWWFFR